MSLRPRFAPAVLVVGALLLAHEAVHTAPARADAIDDAVKSFEDYLKTNPDSQGIRNQIAELGLKKDPRVAKVLMPLLRHPKTDDDVKIAIAQCIGEQGDPAIVGLKARLPGGTIRSSILIVIPARVAYRKPSSLM